MTHTLIKMSILNVENTLYFNLISDTILVPRVSQKSWQPSIYQFPLMLWQFRTITGRKRTLQRRDQPKECTNHAILCMAWSEAPGIRRHYFFMLMWIPGTWRFSMSFAHRCMIFGDKPVHVLFHSTLWYNNNCLLPSGACFANGLWANNSDLPKILYALIHIVVIQSVHKFAQVMTALPLWNVQNFEPIRPLFHMLEELVILQDLSSELIGCLWNGTRSLCWNNLLYLKVSNISRTKAQN